MLEALDRRGLGRHLDAHRVGQDLAREARDFVRHGGGKQQRLAGLGQGRDDLSDVAHEAHVEHPVGLVEDEELDRLEPRAPLAHEVEQAARRGDENVDAAAQGVDLRLLADAAEDHGLAQMQMLAVGAELVADLDREFAGRRQDQGARAARPVVCALSGKLMENRQREGRRLAGAGLGDAQHVPAGEKFGDGPRLDRRRDYMVSGIQRKLYRIGQAEVRETDSGQDGSILMRQLARDGRPRTRPGPGVSLCPGRGRSGLIFDDCSREVAPQNSDASRNRETTYSG